MMKAIMNTIQLCWNFIPNKRSTLFIFIISVCIYQFYQNKEKYQNIIESPLIQSLSNNSNYLSNEWSEFGKSPYVNEGKCTLDRIYFEDLSQNDFLYKFAFSKPFLLIGLSSYNQKFRDLTTRKRLTARFGDTKITLSSANSYSYDRQYIRFAEYCEQYLKPQKLSALATETYYFFGDNANSDWMPLHTDYNLPPLSIPGYSPQLSFGIAGSGSGVPFHFHGPGFAETMWGRKRWFLYPPDSMPNFNPNETTVNWYLNKYPLMKDDPKLVECTVHPGEMIYFPGQWWHATLNVDASVFMSTFLSP